MRIPFFRHKAEEPEFQAPPAHTRVMHYADKFNASVTVLEEIRARVVSDIADKREELRQIDVVLFAMRAGLTTIAADPTLSMGARNEALAHIENKDFAELEAEIGLQNFDEIAS
jgi:hypothetical protein